MSLPVGRIQEAGATTQEVNSLQLQYNNLTPAEQAALDWRIEGIARSGVATMLTTWRAGGPFGGALPYGAQIATLTGDPADDASAISAGTGQRLSVALLSSASSDTGKAIDAYTGQSLVVGSTSSTGFRPEAYGAKADGVTVTDAAMPVGNVLTSASYTFTSADVGKLIAVDGAVAKVTANPLGTLLTTIQSVSGGTATLTRAATVAVTAGEASWATDDTTAINAAITAATVLAGRVTLDAKTYGFTGLTLTGPVRITGQGVFGVYDTFANGPTNFTPTLAPWLEGSVLKCFAAGLGAAIDIIGESRTVDLDNFGIVFAQKFGSTGYGVRSNPGSGKNGLASPRWENVQVFGHDGNSYGFWGSNMAQATLTHLRAWGGGLVRFDQNNGSQYGNSTFIGCMGKLFLAGTAYAGRLVMTGGQASRVGFLGCEFNAFDASAAYSSRPAFAATTPPTSAQKLFDASGNLLRGLSMLSCGFDKATSNCSDPVFAGPLSHGGQFIDPGGFYSFGQNLDANNVPMIAPPVDDGNAIIPMAINTPTILTTASITLTATQTGSTRLLDCTSNAITIRLPTASSAKGRTFTIKKIDASANAVTINSAGGNIDGAATQSLTTQWQKITVMSDGTNWYVVG